MILTESSLNQLKSPRIPSRLKEESPLTKHFRAKEAKESRKLNKGRTFVDEDEDLRIENKLLKFKLDRSSKETQDLKYQLKVNQEVSAALRNTVIEDFNSKKDPEDPEDPYTMDRAMAELLNSSYYTVFLQKIRQNISNEMNFRALIQNQGVLLRTRSIEITFKNSLMQTERGGFWLKYELYVKNLEECLLENLWVVYKQPGTVFLLKIQPFYPN